MEWNESSIAKLRALWAEGLSTAEIGRRMGVQKNAVVGKAHRLNLPSRPSPIRRDVETCATAAAAAARAGANPAGAQRLAGADAAGGTADRRAGHPCAAGGMPAAARGAGYTLLLADWRAG